jgi:hypothetical protein
MSSYLSKNSSSTNHYIPIVKGAYCWNYFQTNILIRMHGVSDNVKSEMSCVLTPRSLECKPTFLTQVQTNAVRILAAFNNLYFARSNCLDRYSCILVGYITTRSVRQTRNTEPRSPYLYIAIHFPTITKHEIL